MVLYILLSGKIGCGKTTFGLLAKQCFPEQINVCHFADKAKELFCKKYDYDFNRILNDREYKESLRNELIKFAQDEKTIYGKDVWAKILVQGTMNNNGIIIIPDLRFYEELNYFISNKCPWSEVPKDKSIPHICPFVTIRINRQDLSVNNHFTETQFDDYEHFDYTINNDGTLDDLRVTVKDIISDIIKNVK